MLSLNEASVQQLELNYKSVYIEGAKILIKLLENIVNEPQKRRYRKILSGKLLLKQKLFILKDVEGVLNAIGYERSPKGNFVLPFTVPVTHVQKYLNYFYERLTYVIAFPEEERRLHGLNPCSFFPMPIDDEKEMVHTEIPGRPYIEKISFPKILSHVNPHLQFLENLSDRFFQYEDEEMQAYTRQHIIPMEMLKTRVNEKMDKIERIRKSGKINEDMGILDYNDGFLIELMNWFHTTFFQSVSDMQCKLCNGYKETRTTFVDNGVRVDCIDCCNVRTSLYLYQDVRDLLRSRKGTFRESVSCFTFMCRCLNYDTRYVHSDYDHAWTEVFLPTQNEWIHFDPVKNIYNSPLVYEHHFSHRITYAVAVSVNDIQNVTRRYTRHYDRSLKSRTHFNETELLKAIQKVRKKRQQMLSKEMKQALKIRNAIELVWLKNKRELNEDVNNGRSSGCPAWKLCRSENNVCNGFVFHLDDNEIQLKQFALRYSCVRDVYERYNSYTGILMEKYIDWKTCLYECENMFLKMEHDWGMVYLCRTHGCNYGRIEWKFDFSRSGLRIKDVFVKIIMKTYENGLIDVRFQHENGNTYKTTAELKDSQKFSIVAELSGNGNDTAWQHAQLFRESLRSRDYPFEIFVEFY